MNSAIVSSSSSFPNTYPLNNRSNADEIQFPIVIFALRGGEKV